MAKATKHAAQSAGTAVATRKTTAVGPKLDFAADAGAGFESAGKEAFAIPFLAVLQSGSPQCKKSDGKYIKGAEEGSLLNTVTNEVTDGNEGIEIIPCSFNNTFVEWGTRESGGGFINEYPAEVGQAMRATAKRDDKNRDILPNGHVVSDHRNHYLLAKDADGNWSPVLMSLTSTQIKASRNWMSQMQRLTHQHNVPMFALVFRMTTVPQSNDKGSWYGVAFEHTGFVEDEETYSKAKAFYAQVRSGAVKTSAREMEGATGPGSDSNPDDM